MSCLKDKCKNYGKLKPCAVFKMEEEQFEPDVCGIVSQYYLMGMAYAVAEKIKKPVSIFQRIPSGCGCNALQKMQSQCELYKLDKCACDKEFYEQLMSKAKYARLVVDVNYGDLCSKIRDNKTPMIENNEQDLQDCNYNECWCYYQDSSIAEYFLGNNNEKSELIEKLKLVEEETEAGDKYVRCICSRTGQTELAFKVDIGVKGLTFVLICGQFLLDGESDSQDNIKKNHELSDKFGANHLETIKLDTLKTIASEVFVDIETLKKRILTVYETRIKSINFRHICKAIPEIASEDWQYDDLKNKVRSMLDDFAKIADISKISCFMTNHLNEHMGKDLTNEHGDSIEVSFINKNHNRKLELVVVDKVVNEVNKDGLSSNLLGKDYSHLIFPSDGHQFNIVVLLKITDENFQDQLLMEEYKEYFKIMLPVIRGVASGLFFKHKNEVIDRFTRDLRHELGQSNMGFIANVEYFEDNIKGFKNKANNNIIENIIKNAKSYAYTTMLRTNTSRYMIQVVPTPNYSYFLPYGAFLYKWSEVYYDRMSYYGLQLKLTNLDKDEDGTIKYDMRPRMYADQDMIEQVAYNLTNNAMKYSLPGTTVSLDCCLNEDKDKYQLIVTSYGISLKDDEYARIFDDGFQGGNAIIKPKGLDQKNSEGRGLALSKEIAEKHGGSLDLIHEEISTICVPYFESYLEVFNSVFWKSAVELYGAKDLSQEIKAETQRLKRDYPEYWKEMNVKSNKRQKDIPFIITNIITKGVTRYTFILSIPHKGRG